MKKLICRIIDHDFDKDALENSVMNCKRCGQCDYFGEKISNTLPYLWRILIFRIRHKYRMKIGWKIRGWIRRRKDDDVPF